MWRVKSTLASQQRSKVEAAQPKRNARHTRDWGTAESAEESTTLERRYDIPRDVINTTLLHGPFGGTDTKLNLEVFRLDDTASDTADRRL